jgi:phage terminase large subunit-like protein
VNAPFDPTAGGAAFRAWARRVLATFATLTPEERRRAYEALPPAFPHALRDEFWWHAHGGQIEPDACPDGQPWRIWAIVAGRGFGKTRAGAEWVWQRARDHPDARIALVAASLDEVAHVMVEGESGLLACARCGEAPRWLPSRGLFHFPSGAVAYAHTAERPARLRGFQHHFAWCVELAKWGDAGPSAHRRAGARDRAAETWDNLLLGLRLGDAPRTIVTTTPQPIPLLKRILALPRCAATHGRTAENPHLPADFREAVTEMYVGTRLGRQELDGELLDDTPGALWTREMLEKCRIPQILPSLSRGGGPHEARGRGESEANPLPERQDVDAQPLRQASGLPPPLQMQGRINFTRIVIGLDPPATATGDACGILVCGIDREDILYVLADHSAHGLSPEAWARRVAAAADTWGATLVVAEKNQGGDMIGSVLRGVDVNLPVRLVNAGLGKAARAEPVALRFETGRAKLAGSFPDLEDELCAMTYGGYEGEGSPDRADAMVWAMTELMKPNRQPRVRGF